MELAAIKVDLDLIKWLRSQDPPCEWSKKVCTAAAWANRWYLLRVLVIMGCPIDKGGMFGVVVRDPNDGLRRHSLPQKVTFCSQDGVETFRVVPHWSCNSLPDSWDGKLEILKWLQREHGCIFGAPEDLESFELYDLVRNVAEAAGECSDVSFSALLLSYH